MSAPASEPLSALTYARWLVVAGAVLGLASALTVAIDAALYHRFSWFTAKWTVALFVWGATTAPAAILGSFGARAESRARTAGMALATAALALTLVTAGFFQCEWVAWCLQGATLPWRFQQLGVFFDQLVGTYSQLFLIPFTASALPFALVVALRRRGVSTLATTLIGGALTAAGLAAFGALSGTATLYFTLPCQWMSVERALVFALALPGACALADRFGRRP